jgi:hypothetical protein
MAKRFHDPTTARLEHNSIVRDPFADSWYLLLIRVEPPSAQTRTFRWKPVASIASWYG